MERMKATVDGKRLGPALGQLGEVLSTRQISPVLAGVRVAVDEPAQQIELRATDGEQYLTITVPAEAWISGVAIVDGRRLVDLARELRDEAISLRRPEGGVQLVVATGAATVRLPVIEDEYPEPFVPGAGAVEVEVPGALLAAATKQALYAVAKGAGLPSMQGLLLSLAGAEGICLGADGQRFARVRVPLDPPASAPLRALLLPAAVKTLGGLLREQARATLRAGANALEVVGPEGVRYRYTVRLLEGAAHYPETVVAALLARGRVLPAVQVAAADLAAAVRQVLVVAEGKLGAVSLSIGGGHVTVAAGGDAGGEAEVRVPAASAVDTHVRLSGRHLLDALGQLGSGTVALRAAGGEQPVLLGEEGAEHLIAPMRG